MNVLDFVNAQKSNWKTSSTSMTCRGKLMINEADSSENNGGRWEDTSKTLYSQFQIDSLSEQLRALGKVNPILIDNTNGNMCKLFFMTFHKIQLKANYSLIIVISVVLSH